MDKDRSEPRDWFALKMQTHLLQAFPNAEAFRYYLCSSFLLEDGDSVAVNSWGLVRRCEDGIEVLPAIGGLLRCGKFKVQRTSFWAWLTEYYWSGGRLQKTRLFSLFVDWSNQNQQ